MTHLPFIANGDEMKTLLFTLALISLPVQAQITFFNDSLGMPLGTANQIGNTTFYSDAWGYLSELHRPLAIQPFIAIVLDCHWELLILRNPFLPTHHATVRRQPQPFLQRRCFQRVQGDGSRE